MVRDVGKDVRGVIGWRADSLQKRLLVPSFEGGHDMIAFGAAPKELTDVLTEVVFRSLAQSRDHGFT